MTKKIQKLTFLDLFAGAGGLAEGFIRAGFQPAGFVEKDSNSCLTIKTRLAYHYLSSIKKEEIYLDYLLKKITRDELYKNIPEEIINTVINKEINGHSIKGIFQQIDKTKKSDKIDIIIGGPPCQAYSLAGRSRDPHRMKKDKRNYLFRYYVKFLDYYKPKYFIFENVTGLLSAGLKKYLNEMRTLFSETGYTTDLRILNAADFDVLQIRKRVIIIGKLNDSNFVFPEIEEFKNSWKIKQDLFDDLPQLSPGESLNLAYYTKDINTYLKKTAIRNGNDYTTQHITRPHNQQDLEIYSIVSKMWLKKKRRIRYNELPERLQSHKKKDIFLDRFKVIDPDGLSHTLVAHISKDGHYYIYPDLNQIRSISVREAARIQSFPDDYFFEGSRTNAFTQIGNAVPPLMAGVLANKILEML